MTRHSDDKRSFQIIVSQHAARFPHWQVDDIYKLVFQAAMGSEHAAADPDKALERLASETGGIAPDPTLPLIMPLSPDYRLVRIGLKPYLAVGGDLDKLAVAFVQTAHTFRPSRDRLIQYWSWVEGMAANGALSQSLSELTDYIDKRRSQGYPAVHHSDPYRRGYGPAYRVVLRDLISLPT